jgi:lysozyme
MTEITARECEALLNADIDAAETLARHYVPAAQLDGEVRYRALVEMAFNLGGRLGEFKKFLAAVNGGDWATAGKEMADSTWATQVGERAVRLRGLIETGQG